MDLRKGTESDSFETRYSDADSKTLSLETSNGDESVDGGGEV